MRDRGVSLLECSDGAVWGEDPADIAGADGSQFRAVVAIEGPLDERALVYEPGPACDVHDHAVGQTVKLGPVAALAFAEPSPRNPTLLTELAIDVRGGVLLVTASTSPGTEVRGCGVPPALEAGSVPSGKGRRLVQEEQFGVVARSQQLALSPLEGQFADDPRTLRTGPYEVAVVEHDGNGGLSVSSQSLGWPPLALTEFVPEVDFPILAENGAKTMATAETWAGPAEASRHCVAALVGRGVGAGVVEDAQLLRGATGSAGEWGHTKVAIDGRACHCGGHGCLEAYIGGTSIVEQWGAAGGATTGDDEADLATLLHLADDGDQPAATVLEDTIHVLGIGLANLVNLLNPDVIVLGGWVGRAIGAERLEAIRSAMLSQCLTQPGTAVDLRLSRLGDDAVSLGAALLPLQRLINGDLEVGTPG